MGGSGTVAGWNITLNDVYAIEGPNWYADRADLTARKGSAKAELAVYLNPLIDMVYLGVLLMGLGALFSLWPTRRRAADGA